MTSEEIAATAAELRELILEESNDPHLSRKARKRHFYIAELKNTLADEYGIQHGWKISHRSFTIEALARGFRYGGKTFPGELYRFFDHSFYFKDTEGRAVGIVSHLYDRPRPSDLKEMCDRYGLRAEEETSFPSWWFPGRTKMFLFTRRPS